MEPVVVIIIISFTFVTLISSLLLAVSSSNSWTSTIARVGGVFGTVLLTGTFWALSTFWNSAEQKFYIIPTLLWLGVLYFAIGGMAGAVIVLTAKAVIQFVRRHKPS